MNVTPIFNAQVPKEIEPVLAKLVDTLKSQLGVNLISVLLFGSAAEGRLRILSDVNVLIVLKNYDLSQINPLRTELRLVQAAINLRPMFVLKSELQSVAFSFADKFLDIMSRHLVLYGEDVVESLKIPREVEIARLRQSLLNLSLRLRSAYALISLREEQLIPVITETSAPLRVIAASILELEGHTRLPPREALERFTHDLTHTARSWQDVLNDITTARRTGKLPAGHAEQVMIQLLELCQMMLIRLQTLAGP